MIKKILFGILALLVIAPVVVYIKTRPSADIPDTGVPDRAGMLVTKTLLFAGQGSGMYSSDFPGGNHLLLLRFKRL